MTILDNKLPNKEKEQRNASQFPRVFYCRHMQPGIAKYENETILVDTDAIKKMMPSAIGKPVYIFHQDVDLEKLKEQAAGYIVDSFYLKEDGWAWFKFLAIDDACYNAIEGGWSVSNAYLPTNWGGSGTKNNAPFDREVLDGEFTHLAIVPDPRYEKACIMTSEQFKIYKDNLNRELEELHNSKTNQKGKTMFKLFKNTKEEVSTVDADTMVEIENGKSVSITEMINAIKKNDDDAAAKKAAEKAAEEEKKNADPMVKVNGEDMPLSELINQYNAMMKKNAGDDDAADEDADDLENADDDVAAGKKAEKEAEKKNGKDKTDHFTELKNAHNKAQEPVAMIETSIDQCARGTARYGSAKASK